MASTPTTKPQVQAYRFVLRRMESALVRKDPIMVHDPMASHRRATIGGAIAAAVGLIAFGVLGLVSPTHPLPTGGIVIGAQSGQVYVISQHPERLIPVFNVASARLLLMVAANNGNPVLDGASPGTSTAAPPVMVDDSQLAASGIPTGRLTGIPDGPQALPAPGNGTGDWAICDYLRPDLDAPDPTAGVLPRTTVLVGETAIGTDLPDDQAVLVSDPDGRTYLIYHRSADSDDGQDDSAVRAEVDPTDPYVRTALLFDTGDPLARTPRPVSAALLSAIPSVGMLTNPLRGYAGGPPSYLLPRNVSVGQSFEVPAGGATDYYLALADGDVHVSQTVADIVQFERQETALPRVSGHVLSTLPRSDTHLRFDRYPATLPRIVPAATRPALCLGWTYDASDPNKPLARNRITLDTQVDLPAEPADPHQRMPAVPIGQPSPSGEKIDEFLMNPGYPAIAVRSVANATEGQIYIVTARGVTYSVPDQATAHALGIANAGSPDGLFPAPASILRLLPASSQTLDTENVMHTFDGVPVSAGAGMYLTPSSAQHPPN